MFYNWNYVSNPQNEDLDYLPFYVDERLFTIWWIYCKNDDIVEMFNSGLIIGVNMNWMPVE